MSRIMLAATHSGAGKTSLTVALLRLFKERGLDIAAFKTGPDTIDPLFHRQALGVQSYNLDSYLCDPAELQAHYQRHAARDLNLIEGVMGFYDGIAPSGRASAHEVATILQIPVLLLVDVKGAGQSIAALLRGFKHYKEPNLIQGVIFNRCSPGMYTYYAGLAREEGLRPYGYLPELSGGSHWAERRLGLLTPAEQSDVAAGITHLAQTAAASIELEALMALAQTAGPISHPEAVQPTLAPAASLVGSSSLLDPASQATRPKHWEQPRRKLRVALARDAAFPLYYAENESLLQRFGAELCYFSPLEDESLPANCAALWLGTGFPWLYAERLAANVKLRHQLKELITAGLPTIAEGSGNLYLRPLLAGQPMLDILPGHTYEADKLQHFGYVELQAAQNGLLLAEGARLKAHEFHYWQVELAAPEKEESFQIRKASGKGAWCAGLQTASLYAAFPQIYLPGNLAVAERFWQAALRA